MTKNVMMGDNPNPGPNISLYNQMNDVTDTKSVFFYSQRFTDRCSTLPAGMSPDRRTYIGT